MPALHNKDYGKEATFMSYVAAIIVCAIIAVVVWIIGKAFDVGAEEHRYGTPNYPNTPVYQEDQIKALREIAEGLKEVAAEMRKSNDGH